MEARSREVDVRVSRSLAVCLLVLKIELAVAILNLKKNGKSRNIHVVSGGLCGGVWRDGGGSINGLEKEGGDKVAEEDSG